MTAASPTQHSIPRRLFVGTAFGAAAVYVLRQSLAIEQYASELEITGLFLLFGALTSLYAAWVGWDELHAEREARDRALEALESSSSHGQSRFADLNDLKRAGMLENPKGAGIFLGQLDGHDIHHNREGSALVLAPPGMGKTTALAIPHGLQNTTPTICIDPKGELYATTARQRRRMGHRIWVISPWSEELRKQSNGRIDLPEGDGFDPIAWLDPESANVISDANLVAGLLLPQQGQSTSDSSEFFRTYAKEILVSFALYSLSAHGSVTLTGLRRMLMSSPDELDVIFAEMVLSDAFSGELSVLANRLQGTRSSAPKQWLGALDTAVNGIAWADSHSPLGKSVLKNGVDWARFYDAPTTVYIVAPPDAIATYGQTWLAACITVAQELLARARSRERVTFLVDEFQNLGRQDALLRGLALYRSFARYVFAVQYVSALERLYGPSWKEFLGCEVVMAFGATSDHATLKLLSDLAGSRTVTKTSFAEQDAGFSASTGTEGTPLIRPEEIRTLPDGKALIFAGTLPPILADKAPYYTVRRWRRAADPNPYQ